MEASLRQTSNETEITYLDIYEPVFSFKGRYIHLKGGRSGARSTFGVTYFLLRLLAPPEFIEEYGWSTYFRGYFMRFVATDIRESLFREFSDLVEQKNLSHLFKINEHEMTIECLLNGNMIISKGFRKSQNSRTGKMKSIAGATHVLIDEADEVDWESFRKMNESLRTVKGDNPQVIMCYNTETPDWWGWDEFYSGGIEKVTIAGTTINLDIPKPDPNILVIHATMYDNLLYTHPDTVQLYESYAVNHSDVHRVTVLGERAIVKEGVIFREWELIEEFPEHILSGFGLDFGFSFDPTAIIRVAIKGDKMYLDEYIYELGLTNKMISEKCKALGITIADEIIADTDPKDITDLRTTYDHKLNIRAAYKGAGSIEYGYRQMLRYKIFVTRRSKNLISELRHHCYAKDAEDNYTRKPEDKWNHALDAARYYVQTKRKGGAYW